MKATNLLSSLNLTAKPAVGSADPVQNRRNKLLARLEEQRAMACAELAGESYQAVTEKQIHDAASGTKMKVSLPKRIKRWYFAFNGTHFFEVRYGNMPLELAKGKSAIEVGELKNVPAVIDTIVQAVNAGELDSLLMAIKKPAMKAAS